MRNYKENSKTEPHTKPGLYKEHRQDWEEDAGPGSKKRQTDKVIFHWKTIFLCIQYSTHFLQDPGHDGKGLAGEEEKETAAPNAMTLLGNTY